MTPGHVERACEVLHAAYETAAEDFGWETQARSRVPWDEVPEANKATMRVAVAALLAWHGSETVAATFPVQTSRPRPLA